MCKSAEAAAWRGRSEAVLKRRPAGNGAGQSCRAGAAPISCPPSRDHELSRSIEKKWSGEVEIRVAGGVSTIPAVLGVAQEANDEVERYSLELADVEQQIAWLNSRQTSR